jgi:hypothetical protein
MLTVGASSIDRAFDSPIKLGNGVAIMVSRRSRGVPFSVVHASSGLCDI